MTTKLPFESKRIACDIETEYYDALVLLAELDGDRRASLAKHIRKAIHEYVDTHVEWNHEGVA